MSWGTRRRNFIVGFFVTIFLLISSTLAFMFFYEEPNCFDKKKNGNEQGVDCGGSCKLVCSDETVDLITHWSRYFKVAPGIYNAIAYIENQNIDAGINNLEYEFKIYDEEGTTLDQRKGKINIRPKEIIPIIENNLNTGERIPTRLDFRFTSPYVWEKQDLRRNDIIVVDERIFEEEKTFTKIVANLLNTSIENIKNIRAVILVYDKNDNVIASSSTLIEELVGNTEKGIIFTWPSNFNSSILRFEIIPLYE